MIYNMVSLRDQGVIYGRPDLRVTPWVFFPIALSASTLPDLTLQPSRAALVLADFTVFLCVEI